MIFKVSRRLLAVSFMVLLSGLAGNVDFLHAASLTWDNFDGTGAWNTSDANWNGGADTFTGGEMDDVLFSGTAPGTVTIHGPGVDPLSLSVTSNAPNDYTFTGGPIFGGTSLDKSGTSTLFLRSANTFSGGINHSAGVIDYDAADRLGSGPVNFTGNATLTNSGATNTTTNDIAISDGVTATILSFAGGTKTYSGVISGGTALNPITLNISSPPGSFNSVALSGANTFIGTVRLLERQRITVDSDADFGPVSNQIIGAGANAGINFSGSPVFSHDLRAESFTSIGGSATLSGNLSSLSNNSFFQGSPSSVITLTGNNTHQRWTFQGGGVLVVSDPDALGSATYGPNTGSTNSTVRFAGAATGTYTANMNIATDDLTLDVVEASSIVTLTGGVTGNRVITSSFGLAGLVKTGAGRLDLNGTVNLGANTFHRVVDGTLNINVVTNANQGDIIVEAGGTLGGTGVIQLGEDTDSVASLVTIDGGLAPGAGGAGTLTISSSVDGGLVLNPTAQLSYDFGAPTGVNDLVDVGGNLTLDGTLSVNDIGGFGIGVYRLFNYSGTLTNNGLALSGLGDTAFLDLSTPGQVNLVIPVPEPGTGLLLAIPALLFTLRRRRPSQR